jgi:hypothetical protein
MSDVALHVNLGLLAIAGGRQCHHAEDAWTDSLGDSLDDAALAAASLPSKMTRIRAPDFLTQACSWASSTCRYLSLLL